MTPWPPSWLPTWQSSQSSSGLSALSDPTCWKLFAHSPFTDSGETEFTCCYNMFYPTDKFAVWTTQMLTRDYTKTSTTTCARGCGTAKPSSGISSLRRQQSLRPATIWTARHRLKQASWATSPRLPTDVSSTQKRSWISSRPGGCRYVGMKKGLDVTAAK